MARKIILTQPPQAPKVEAPSLQTLLNNCQILIGKEIERIIDKSNRGHALLADEVKTITAFMRTLIDLGKLHIAQQQADDLSKLTDQELTALGAKALKKLKDDLKSNA